MLQKIKLDFRSHFCWYVYAWLYGDCGAMALKIAADLLLVIPDGNFKYLLPFFTQEIVTEKRRSKVSRCSIAWLDTLSLGFGVTVKRWR